MMLSSLLLPLGAAFSLARLWLWRGPSPSQEWIMTDVKPKRKQGRPKIHPDRKAYQAEWVRKKRAKEKLS